MVIKVVSVVFVCLYVSATVTASRNDCKSTFCFNIFSRSIMIDLNLFNNDQPLPIEDIIRQFGYPVESHTITTQDGYILTYHRIPHGKSNLDTTIKRKPVLLQHGLLGASSAWVLSNFSLGYTLADAGFDVWLGNARGNTYSRKHVKYDPDKDKKAFWDFSWHEMGYYDLPASIDYILNVTESEQLFYIGHSMGTTMYFVMGATRPEYMDKIHAMVAMAPVVFPRNIRHPLANFLNSLHTVLNLLAKAIGIYEVFPHSDKISWLDRNVCGQSKFKFICKDLMFYLGGFNEKELNRTSLATVLHYMPAGASYKQLRHLRQLTNEDADFTQFDCEYMGIGNIWKYGTLNPPKYNLTNVRAPMYIYYGLNDWLAVPQDVHYAADKFPNVRCVTKVPDDQFNHLDFMWAIDAKTLLYDDIITMLHSLTT